MREDSELESDEKGNVTFWLRKSVADEVRRLKALGQLQPNAIVERALADAVENAKAPTKDELIRRLRAARHERRSGPDYDLGFRRGELWARDVASWDEISHYAGLGHADVSVEHGGLRKGPTFSGAFRAPGEEEHAPLFSIPGEEGPYVSSHPRMVQHWRGWLDGVKVVHAAVRGEMEVAEVPGFAEARSRFVNRVAEEFQLGYAKALEVSKELELRHLDRFAEQSFALKPWLDYMQGDVHLALMEGRAVEFDSALTALMNALGEIADPIGFELPTPGRSFVAGFTQGLQDLWASLSDPADVTRGQRYLRAADAAPALDAPEFGVKVAQPKGKMRALHLSEREKEILKLVADGKTNEQIAARLNIRGKTLRNQLSNIYKEARRVRAYGPVNIPLERPAVSGEEVKPMAD